MADQRKERLLQGLLVASLRSAHVLLSLQLPEGRKWSLAIPSKDSEASMLQETRRLLYSESASGNGKVETLCHQKAFDVDKPRAMLTVEAEASALNFNNAACVSDCFTHLVCAYFVGTRLHYSTMVDNVFSL